LSDDDLIQILNQAKPEEWQSVILGANIELYKFDFQGTVDYFEKLEVRQALEAKRRKAERTENPETTKKGNRKNPEDKSAMSKPQSDKYKKCTHCGRVNHATKDCWFNPENKGKPKPGKKNVSPSDKNILMMQEMFNTILKRLPQNPKSGKRKVRDFTPEDSDAEIVAMFSPKTTISSVDTKDDSDESSIYVDLLSSELLHNSKTGILQIPVCPSHLLVSNPSKHQRHHHDAWDGSPLPIPSSPRP
jgi:hypothetical protein